MRPASHLCSNTRTPKLERLITRHHCRTVSLPAAESHPTQYGGAGPTLLDRAGEWCCTQANCRTNQPATAERCLVSPLSWLSLSPFSGQKYSWWASDSSLNMILNIAAGVSISEHRTSENRTSEHWTQKTWGRGCNFSNGDNPALSLSPLLFFNFAVFA